jgi:hypothetical protein
MPSKLARAACFLYSGAFLFTLVYSTPHRVHHLYDSYKQAHHGSDADRHRNPKPHNPIANDSNCVFQAAANGCQLLLAALVQYSSPSAEVANLTVSVDSAIRQRFLFSPFQVRAPPQV